MWSTLHSICLAAIGVSFVSNALSGVKILSSGGQLSGTEAIRTVKAYDCCPNSYVDVTFHIYLRRRTLSYGANLIVPTLVTSLMAILVFTLPSESGEKVALGKGRHSIYTYLPWFSLFSEAHTMYS